MQPSLRKLTSIALAGSALLFGDDLTGRIKSLNAASLMKPAKVISKQEMFGKNPKHLQPSRGSSAYGKKRNLAKAAHFLVAIKLDKIDSRSKADSKNTVFLLFIICHKKLNVLQLETFITTSLNGSL